MFYSRYQLCTSCNSILATKTDEHLWIESWASYEYRSQPPQWRDKPSIYCMEVPAGLVPKWLKVGPSNQTRYTFWEPVTYKTSWGEFVERHNSKTKINIKKSTSCFSNGTGGSRCCCFSNVTWGSRCRSDSIYEIRSRWNTKTTRQVIQSMSGSNLMIILKVRQVRHR